MAAPPLGAAEFAALMARLGPFEPRPLVAVAVSGGADSLALLVLAARWAGAAGGRAVALTVDHRLRLESTDEARAVARHCAERGLDHATLTLPPPPGRSGLEAAAREARYRALDEWGGAQGCLHLLTAHHRDDQAETFLLRLARGSGIDGLAAMSGVRELEHCRLLRPLLGVFRARLRTTLAEAGIDHWADDPMNRDGRFARTRWRGLLAETVFDAEHLATTASRLGEARAALEQAAAELLARSVTLDPAGHAWLDRSFAMAPRDLSLRVLARVLTTIGGGLYPPRYERLVRAHEALTRASARGCTLAGCRLVHEERRLLVCREVEAAAPPLALVPGRRQTWDGRFRVLLAADAPHDMVIGPLGRAALPEEVRKIPGPARPALPALRRGTRLIGLPSLGFISAEAGIEGWLEAFVFRPRRGLSSAAFTVV
jgi:tRNA(Ile)-lysidine synthase